jgi:DNA-binding PadR family transcriptional regulator
MNERLIKCLASPIKHKLLMAINEQERATTKELAQIAKHVPQATLYRYLKKMVADKLIKVVDENKIRNVTEKVYGMAIDLESELKKIADDKSGATFMVQFQNFANGIREEFESYLSDNEIPSSGFAFGFGMLPIHVTNKEAWELYKKIEEMLQPYHNNPLTEDRELRNFAMIFTPPSKA